MSLMIFSEPKTMDQKQANELGVGTWFVDPDDQIFVIVLDDRTNERRILCCGNFYKPFITNVPLKDFSVKRILKPGTLLQISSITFEGDQDEHA